MYAGGPGPHPLTLQEVREEGQELLIELLVTAPSYGPEQSPQ